MLFAFGDAGRTALALDYFFIHLIDATYVIHILHKLSLSSFRDAPPTSNGWHLVAGDELIKTEVKVDTTPLGSNIKNFRFRSNGKRKFNVVKKTAKPLISYFE